MTETTPSALAALQRYIKRPVALLVIMAMALAVGTVALAIDPVRARAQPSAGIEGSWLVRLPDFGDEHQLASFLPGGVVLATNAPTELDEQDGEREYNSPGHGAWTSLGDSRYAFSFLTLIFDDRGTFSAMYSVDATVTLDATGDRFSGSLTVRGMMPDGREVFTSPPLSIEATRIRPPAAR